MKKLTRLASPADLKKLKDASQNRISLRNYERKPTDKKFQILVCGGTGCISSQSLKVRDELQQAIKDNKLEGDVEVITTGCHGFCELGPLVIVYPGGTFYVQVKPEDAREIIQETIIKGGIVERLLYSGRSGKTLRKTYNDVAFYNLQTRHVLRNCGRIDPEDITEYIAKGGYEGLVKAMEMGPEAALNEVIKSGLRGRGGGGFPTG